MIFVTLLALSGILFGFLLAVIAPEELKPGRKYFSFLRKILLTTIFVLVAYIFFTVDSILSLVFTVGMLLVMIVGEFKFRTSYFNFVYYPFFVLPIFLFTLYSLQLILVVLIFL